MDHRFDFYMRGITYDQCIALFDAVVDCMNTYGGHVHEFHMWTPNDENDRSHLSLRTSGLRRSTHSDVFNTLAAAVQAHGGHVTSWAVHGDEDGTGHPTTGGIA